MSVASRRSRLYKEAMDPDLVTFYEKYKDLDNAIPICNILKAIEDLGFNVATDPRLVEIKNFLAEKVNKIELGDFEILFQISEDLLLASLKGELAIPHILKFRQNLNIMFEACQLEHDGFASTETPYLANQNTDCWGISVYSVDGQVINIGNSNSKFILHKCSRPFLFLLAVKLLGLEKTQSIIGMDFNFLEKIEVLNKKGVPANVLSEAGGITLASWIKNEGLNGKTGSEVFDYFDQFMKKLAGGKYIRFCNSAYMSQKETAQNKLSLIYYLNRNKCLPENNCPEEDLDFYLTISCYEVDGESLSMMAATIANYGENVYTSESILPEDLCKNVLSMMSVCGPYKEWPYETTLPACSGGSGCFLIVFPGIMAMTLFSPGLARNKCSYRAVKFAEAFSQAYFLNRFAEVQDFSIDQEIKLRVTPDKCPHACWLHYAVTNNDIYNTVNIVCSDFSICKTNYLGRTLLHDAASAGNLECVKLLISACPRLLDVKDRMEFTPMDDAIFFGHDHIVNYFERWYILKTGKPYSQEVKSE